MPTKPTHGVTHSEGAAHALTVPSVRWVEPTETTTVTTYEPLVLAGNTGMLVTYARDTHFAGNLTECLKVMGFR